MAKQPEQPASSGTALEDDAPPPAPQGNGGSRQPWKRIRVSRTVSVAIWRNPTKSGGHMLKARPQCRWYNGEQWVDTPDYALDDLIHVVAALQKAKEIMLSETIA